MNYTAPHFPRSAQLICLDTPPCDSLDYFAQMPFAPVSSHRHYEIEALLGDLRTVGCEALIMQVDEDGSRLLALYDEHTGNLVYRRGVVATPLMLAFDTIEEPVSELEDHIATLIENGVSYSVDELMDAALGIAA